MGNFAGSTNTSYEALDGSRVVHPSKYVFSPTLMIDSTLGRQNTMIWTGGAKDRNVGNDTTYSSYYDSVPFTMEYISYKFAPDGQSTTRTDKGVNNFIDVSGSVVNNDLKSHLQNDTSMIWEDIYGKTSFSFGDGYVDNSRYRWNGSTYGSTTAGLPVKLDTKETPTLKNKNVSFAPTFAVHKKSLTLALKPDGWINRQQGDNWRNSDGANPMRAYMSADNQANYWKTIEFFSTRKRADGTGNLGEAGTFGKRNESREAKSEMKRFQSAKIAELE